MATLKVEVVKIKSVEAHPNADRLDIVTVLGYTVVTAKGQYQVGDLAAYFPLDSVLPEELIDNLGVRPYYKGKLKAAKLRGIFSEGLLAPLDETYTLFGDMSEGADLTDLFGVTKWEPPVIPTKALGGCAEAPIGEFKFPSPEHWKRYSYYLEPGELVGITEKIHGTNFSIKVDEDGTNHVGSHNFFWRMDTNNVYTRAHREFPELQCLPPNTQVFGEIYGVQDLKYGLKAGAIDYAVFAVKVDGVYLDFHSARAWCYDYGLKAVPLLYVGAYDPDVVRSFNNKTSTLANHIMEGVVVQPLVERYEPRLGGRLVLKFISDSYLLRKGETTENH